MIRAALIALASLALAGAAAAQTAIAVRGEWISLADVAGVTGEAGKVLVSPAPPPGQKLALDAAFVTGVAKQAGVAVALPDQPIWVTRVAATQPAAKPAQAPAADSRVLVLTRDIARGDIIRAEDLDWETPANGRAPRNVASDPDLIAGQMAKRTLKAGAMIYATDHAAPHVIRKGQPVRIIYSSRGLKLSVDGVAQADAAAGDSVRVLNTYTRRPIDAVATAQGEARVSRD